METEAQPQQVSLNISRLFMIVTFSVLLTAIITGSAIYFWQKSENQKAIGVLEREISILREQVSEIKSRNEALPSSHTNDVIQLEDILEFSKYNPINSTQLTAMQDNKYQFIFNNGQNRENNIHNNYSVTFPDSWIPFVYTSDENRDDYGTNVILKKDTDYIRIKQQLFESGSCVFEEEEVQLMSYLCSLVQIIESPHEDWKVFTVPNSNFMADGKDPWLKYGICDQEKYSQDIGSYKTPDEHDKKVCSPWTQVGEIEFFSLSGSQHNFQDFVSITQSIRVIN